MSQKGKVPSSDEAWEEGALGRDEAYVERADEGLEAAIDEAVELQMISIRLQKSLIDDFKLIAEINGLGYQTLMRQILKRFADCEKKRILREYASDAAKVVAREMAREKAAAKEQTQQKSKPRKVA